MKTNLDNEMAQRIAVCLQSMNSDIPIRDGPHKFFQYDKWVFELERPAAIAFDEVITLLKQCDELAQMLSEKEIRRQFQQLLGQLYTKYGALDHKKTIKNEIHLWWNKLFSLPEESVTYYYVIEGVSLSKQMKLGIASIEQLDDARYEELGQRFFDVINNNPYYCPSAKHLHNQALMENWLPHFEPSSGRRLALVSIPVQQRDSGLGSEVAVARLDEVIDFLRFAALKNHYDLQRPISIAIKGRIGNQVNINFAFYEDGHWQLNVNQEGSPVVPLHDIPSTLLDVFCGMLAKEESSRTQIEDKLLRAIQYLGKAAAEPVATNQLIFAWFTLETLFQTYGESITGDELSARGAALLAGDSAHYRKLKEALIEVKRTRNKIVHLGLVKLTADEKKLVVRVKKVAFTSICAVAELAKQYGWTEAEDIDQYIEERMKHDFL